MLTGSKISEDHRTYSIMSLSLALIFQMTAAGRIVKTILIALIHILWLKACSIR